MLILTHYTDINTVPTFTNLPKNDKVGVMENEHSAGDTVFQISVEDPDTEDDITIYCNFPDGGDEYFRCDETSKLM